MIRSNSLQFTMFTMWKIYPNYDNLTKIASCINYVKFANIRPIMNEKLLMLNYVCDESFYGNNGSCFWGYGGGKG